MLIGPPAAGKSTLAEQLAGKGYAIVDADEAKKLISGYNGGLGAQVVHEESSAMSKIVQAQYSNTGKNVLIQTTSHSSASAAAKIDTLHRAGYNVTVVGMEIGGDEAARRMASRALRTGRTVPVGIMADAPRLTLKTFETVKDLGNGYARVNSGGRGDPIVTQSTAPWLVPGQPVLGKSRDGGGTVRQVGGGGGIQSPLQKAAETGEVAEVGALPFGLNAAGLRKTWDESKHPRDPGGEGGGQFVAKEGPMDEERSNRFFGNAKIDLAAMAEANRKNVEAGGQALTEAEYRALRMYSDNKFTTINQRLRAGGDYLYEPGTVRILGVKPLSGKTLENFQSGIQVLDSALAKSPAFEGVVQRVMEAKTEDLPHMLEYYKVGQTVTEKAFTSTTRGSVSDLGDALGWVNELNVTTTIRDAKGFDVSHLSAASFEKEVLLPRNSRFLVESVKKTAEGRATGNGRKLADQYEIVLRQIHDKEGPK